MKWEKTARWAGVLGMLAITGASMAYLISHKKIINTIQVGENTILITEEFEPPKNQTVGENKFVKRVQIKNTDQTDCFVRVFMEFSDSDIKKLAKISPDGKNWYEAEQYSSLKANGPENWIYISEKEDELLGGFYYYKTPLKAGEKTSLLMDQIMVTYSSPSQLQDFEVVVVADSVQTAIYKLQEDGSYITEDVSERENGWKLAWTEYLERR